MMTKEQAAAVIAKANADKARRRVYNQKRWQNKKSALAEAKAVLLAAPKAPEPAAKPAEPAPAPKK